MLVNVFSRTFWTSLEGGCEDCFIAFFFSMPWVFLWLLCSSLWRKRQQEPAGSSVWPSSLWRLPGAQLPLTVLLPIFWVMAYLWTMPTENIFISHRKRDMRAVFSCCRPNHGKSHRFFRQCQIIARWPPNGGGSLVTMDFNSEWLERELRLWLSAVMEPKNKIT